MATGGQEEREGERPHSMQPLRLPVLLAIEEELCDLTKRPKHWERARAKTPIRSAAQLAQHILHLCRSLAHDNVHTPANEKRALTPANLYKLLSDEHLVSCGRQNFTTALRMLNFTINGIEVASETGMRWILNGKRARGDVRTQTEEEAKVARRIMLHFWHGEWLKSDQDPTEARKQPHYFWQPLAHTETPARYIELAAMLRRVARLARDEGAQNARIVNVSGCVPFRERTRGHGGVRDDDSETPSVDDHVLSAIWDGIGECVAAGVRVDFIVPSPCPGYLNRKLFELERRMEPLRAKYDDSLCRITRVDVARGPIRTPRADLGGRGKEERWPWEYFSRQWRYVAARSPGKTTPRLEVVSIRPSLSGYVLNHGMHSSELEVSHFWHWVDAFAE